MKEYEDKIGIDKLAILWTSAEREVAMHFALKCQRDRFIDTEEK